MQTVPIYATVDGLTLFGDDRDPTHFHYLPRLLRIKRDQAGRPMFTFLKYTLPLERQTEQDKGGGYLVFTTELTEDPKFLQDKVIPFLKQRLRGRFGSGVQPTLSATEFLDGGVRLMLMQDDRFVGAFQSGKPSLFGDNTASFAVELKDLGAELFYQALKKGKGVAVVEYDLSFDIRLPAVHVHVYANSREFGDINFTQVVENVEGKKRWWILPDDPDRKRYHRGSISEVLTSMGHIEVTIDEGTSDLDDADVQSLRDFAFTKLDKWIDDNFLKGSSVATPEELKSVWLNSVHQDVYKTFSLDLTQNSVVQRQYNPSGQVTPQFLGAKIDDLIQEIDLGTAAWYFNNLDVTVDTNLDFEKFGDIVHSVVGHLSYEGTTKNGDRIAKRESVAFTAADRAPKHFRTRLAAVGADRYTVELEVNYKNGPVASAVLGKRTTNVRNLTLAVPNPGVMELTVGAQDAQAFDALNLSSIEVEIGYGDPSRKVPDAVDTVVLTKEQDTVDYRRVIYAAWDKPYRVRRTYVLTGDDGDTQRITTEWETVQHDPNRARQFLSVGTPFDSVFNLTVMPSVDWTEVANVLVDVEYSDEANDYRQKSTFSFSRDSLQPITWKFPLRDSTRRAYRYSEKMLMANQAAKIGTWVDAASDADTLVVGNAKGGVVTLEVDAGDTGLGDTLRRVVVRLRYPGTGTVTDSATLVFRDATPQQWFIAQTDPPAAGYAYDVEYVYTDGTVLTVPGQAGTIAAVQDFLFLPAAPEQRPAPPAPPVPPAPSPVDAGSLRVPARS